VDFKKTKFSLVSRAATDVKNKKEGIYEAASQLTVKLFPTGGLLG